MIKKKGCNPCKMFEPTIKSVASQNQLDYKSVQAEDMPENMRPDVFPYFYLIEKEKMLQVELKDLKHKIDLITGNDLDYLDMLLREKLKYGTKDEILIKLR